MEDTKQEQRNKEFSEGETKTNKQITNNNFDCHLLYIVFTDTGYIFRIPSASQSHSVCSSWNWQNVNFATIIWCVIKTSYYILLHTTMPHYHSILPLVWVWSTLAASPVEPSHWPADPERDQLLFGGHIGTPCCLRTLATACHWEGKWS